jgi:two-component system, cell cycle sensor histidine kinase and response regulator CckA
VLQPKELSLGTVVVGAERLLQRLIGEDVTLITRSQPNLGVVRADEGQLEQVIVNLAVNARDAMPEGGTLSIETSNVEVGTARPTELSAVPPGAYVLLTVRDTGMGMDAETTARIFEPFFTTKPEGRGTGLGLSTVYGIVKQSGGFVTVTSALHEGALFSIYLPRIPGEVAPRAPEGPRRAAPRGDEVILLADDDAGVRAAVSRELRMQGYTVLEASDGQSALRAAAKTDAPIALLITDVVMPQLSGPALAKQLTAERPRLKVLYVSGYADNALGRHGVLESGIHFLQKPFKPDALALKVREILDGAPVG